MNYTAVLFGFTLTVDDDDLRFISANNDSREYMQLHFHMTSILQQEVTLTAIELRIN